MDKMRKSSYQVVGVMSGTSLDGIDLAHCYLKKPEGGPWDYRFGACQTIPYPRSWKEKLAGAIRLKDEDLNKLNREYTRYLSGQIKAFIDRNGLAKLDAVCSHGHTVHHRPDEGYTLQIGNLPDIAVGLPCAVVCDFRTQDVARGGQGAPLVPIGDELLFPDYDYCLNLGGFANCSTRQAGARIAYDICPVNVVLNHLAGLLGFDMDKGGQLARSGQVEQGLKEALDSLPYYAQQAPKSLGIEWVDSCFLPLVNQYDLDPKDLLATTTSHMAFQIARQFKSGSKVLVSGGGAYNSFLLDSVRAQKELELLVPDPVLLEYKEALVFGLLGVLRLREEINCLASVTGARQDHCSGLLFTDGSQGVVRCRS